MLNYKEMKDKLKANGLRAVDLKQFTADFYKVYQEAHRTKNWDTVRETPFYKECSAAYCQFLEAYNEMLPRWRLTFYKWNDHGFPGAYDVGRTYIHEATEEDAQAFGMDQLERYGADGVNVEKVA